MAVDHPSWPTPRGPWHEADTDPTRIFDHGAHWCANANGHPGYDDYPDPQQHFPYDECRTRPLYIEATENLTGPRLDLEIYAARRYQFGELRTAQANEETRVILDIYSENTNSTPRISVSLGDALRIAAHLTAVVRSIDGR